MYPVVYCPNCRQYLPVQQALPAGMSMQCYRCGAAITVGQQPAQAPPPQQQPWPGQQQTWSAPPQPWPGQPLTNLQPSYRPVEPFAPALPAKPQPEHQRSSAALVVAGASGGALLVVLLVAAVGLAFLFANRQPEVAENPPSQPPAAAPAPAAPSTPPLAPAPSAPATSTAPQATTVNPSIIPSPAPPPTVKPTATTPVLPSSVPAPMPVAAPVKTERGNQLTYGFVPGKHYGYSFRVTIGSKDNLRPQSPREAMDSVRFGSNEVSGFVGYEAKQVDASKLKQLLAGQSAEGSGTAFVVHPDGVLVTCEHVVRSATKIEVTVGQKTYAGRVLGTDRQRDLAVVKVDATGLPSIPLGNSDQVRLAEEVRAVGYPLSDVLGKGVKITRGTIAGFVERGDKLLQIDASINPGNSGGPLVNTKGEVMGVCSSGLLGESVSPVGFAIPSSDVLKFLAANSQSTKAAAVGGPLEGPDLAEKVTPAVAYVKVTLGVDSSDSCMLEYMGHFSAGGVFGDTQHGRGTVIVNRQGEPLSVDGDGTLPFLTGTFAEMILDKLPQGIETTWESKSACLLTIATQTDSSPFGRSPSLRYRGRIRSPLDPEPKQSVTVPALQRISWKLGTPTGDIQVLEKHVEFATLERDSATRLADLSGDGTVSFDLKRGLVKESEMKFNYRGTRGNTTLQTPLTFKCDLYSEQTPEEYAAMLEEARKKSEAARANSGSTIPLPAPKSQTPKPDDAAQVRQLLDELKTLDESKLSPLYTTLCKISFIKPIDELRDEVSRAVDPLLTSKEHLARAGSMTVVKKWFTPHNVPSLLKLLDSLDSSGRGEAIDCLGEHSKDPKVADRLAALLTDKNDCYRATRALEKTGSLAEAPVLPYLSSGVEEARLGACDILRSVGTSKCIADLEKAAADASNRSVRSRAESALREVERRLAKKP